VRQEQLPHVSIYKKRKEIYKAEGGRSTKEYINKEAKSQRRVYRGEERGGEGTLLSLEEREQERTYAGQAQRMLERPWRRR